LASVARPSRPIPLGRVLDAFVADDPPVDAAPPRDLSSAPEHRFWLLPELQERLEKAALGSPMMIAIDDRQWADTARLAGERLASAS
jgi:hypothetical protein